MGNNSGNKWLSGTDFCCKQFWLVIALAQTYNIIIRRRKQKISAAKSFDSTADMAQMVGVSRALKMPHRGIFARRDAKRRARAVRIPPCNPCIVCCKNKKQHPAGCYSWRRRWDSNPRDIAVKLISSQSRYDRFDTSAYLVFIAPPRIAFGKMRDFDAR